MYVCVCIRDKTQAISGCVYVNVCARMYPCVRAYVRVCGVINWAKSTPLTNSHPREKV